MQRSIEEVEQERARLVSRYLGDSRYHAFRTEAGGLNHLAFVTDDMDRTIEFYTGIVRCRLLRIGPMEARPESTQVFFDLGGGQILLFLWINGTSAVASPGVGGFHHLSLTVTPQQYESARRRLELNDVPYTVLSHDILDTIKFEDPNGIALEFSVWKKDPSSLAP